VALILLLAGGLKAHQLATEPVMGSGLLDNRWLLTATVEFEILFSFWLLSGTLPKPTWALTLVLFSAFSCVSFYKALSGHATCGCFGRVQVNPWYTTTLDVSIILSLLCWRPKGQEPLFLIDFRHLAVRTAGVMAAWLLVGLPAAFAMASCSETTLSDAGEIIGDGKIVVLEPEKWIGKRFPLFEYIDIGEKLQGGKWLILLYHHDCPKCQETLEKLNGIVRRMKARQIALIEMPPHGDSAKTLVSNGIQVMRGRLSDVREWFAETPVFLTLCDGRTVTISQMDHTP
jgi:hypothetical protein